MKTDTVVSFVIFLLILQVVATALAWVIGVLSDETSSVFAVLLAANLIAFAVVLQVYRNPGFIEEDSKPEPEAPPAPPPAQSSTSPFKEAK